MKGLRDDLGTYCGRIVAIVEPCFATPSGGEYFFGYFDKTPFSASSALLLAQRASFNSRMPTAHDRLELGYFDWQRSDQFQIVTDTNAWNWQQGCMLQWLGTESQSKIIFNARGDTGFESRIFDIETGAMRLLPLPIYALARTGRQALCIDFERHYWYRSGYAYEGVVNRAKQIKLDPNDGIWLMDVGTGALRQVVKLSDLLPQLGRSSDVACHYFEHIAFSPNEQRMAFLHRARFDDGRIVTRLVTADIDGADLRIINDSGRVTHFSWRNDNEILCFGALPTLATRFAQRGPLAGRLTAVLKPLYRQLSGGANAGSGHNRMSRALTGDGYLLIDCKSGSSRRVGVGALNRDGHPTFSPVNPDMFVSDTYPDITNEYNQELFTFDLRTAERQVLALHSCPPPWFDSAFRADLHPRWSNDGRYVSVDVVLDGARKMLVYCAALS